MKLKLKTTLLNKKKKKRMFPCCWEFFFHYYRYSHSRRRWWRRDPQSHQYREVLSLSLFAETFFRSNGRLDSCQEQRFICSTYANLFAAALGAPGRKHGWIEHVIPTLRWLRPGLHGKVHRKRGSTWDKVASNDSVERIWLEESILKVKNGNL